MANCLAGCTCCSSSENFQLFRQNVKLKPFPSVKNYSGDMDSERCCVASGKTRGNHVDVGKLTLRAIIHPRSCNPDTRFTSDLFFLLFRFVLDAILSSCSQGKIMAIFFSETNLNSNTINTYFNNIVIIPQYKSYKI